ncbi:hypothetical protein P4555_11565 [Peribacillus frigoritolerans]|uniref:hypothetical protein n=1 Tax=Peribacillus frigoritolerans TaxID=450367 RepID=UPI002E1F108E|nr:hypothetical protein [Peribacillus frigoritolerans]
MEWIYKYFSLTAVIAGVGFLIKYLIKSQVNLYFGKKLEKHKQELADMTEKSKYDISKRLFDFEAYATKKHTVYPELYKRLFEIKNQVTKIAFKIENFKTYFGELNEDGISRMDKEILEFTRKFHDAMEYYKMNELFLSKDVAVSCWGALKAMRELSKEWGLISKEFQKGKSDYNFDFSMGQDEIELSMKLLRTIMHKELSYSHFEETEKK